ncbi:MAG: hypothetical protein GY895_10395 [Phycisphaera sp.]|nr:hypothetical protein [Phycisphaera sp.]
MSENDINSGDAETTKDPADEGTELDAFARAARDEPSKENLEPLWSGTLNLDRWFFAGVGKFPNVRPFSGFIDEEPYVMAFTTKARAEKYARLQNLVAEDEKPTVMSFPLVEAAKLCVAQHRVGAKWVVFDDGWGSWRFPLSELGELVRRYHEAD